MALEQVEKREAEIGALKGQAERREVDMQSLKQSKQQESKRVRELEGLLREQDEAASLQREREREEAEATARSVDELENRVRDLSKRLVDQTSASEEEAARGRRIRNELEEEKARIQARNTEMHALLAEQEAASVRAGKQLGEAQAELESMKTGRERENARVRELEGMLQERRQKEKANRITSEREKEAALEEVRHERDAFEARQRELERLVQRRGEAEKELVKMLEKESVYKEEIAELKRALEEARLRALEADREMTEKDSRCKGEMEVLKRGWEDERKRAAEAEEVMMRRREKEAELVNEMELLKRVAEQDLLSKDRELADLVRQAQELQDKLQAAEDAHREQAEKVEVLQGELERCRSQAAEHATELEGELQTTRGSMEEVSATLAAREEKMTALNLSLDKLGQANIDLEKRLADREEAVARLEQALLLPLNTGAAAAMAVAEGKQGRALAQERRPGANIGESASDGGRQNERTMERVKSDASEESDAAAAPANRTTIGVMLVCALPVPVPAPAPLRLCQLLSLAVYVPTAQTDNMIDNLVVGGPAYQTQRLRKGDLIVAVDGLDVPPEGLPAALIGSDQPGSTVTLRVVRYASSDGRRESAGESSSGRRPRLSRELKREDAVSTEESLDVDVIRMESKDMADKARLFELFTDIENHIDDPDSCSQTEALQTVDDAIALWTKMEQKTAQRLREGEEKQRMWEDELRAMQGDERVRQLEKELQESLLDAVALRQRYSRSVRASAQRETRGGEQEQEAAGLLRTRVEELENELRDALRTSGQGMDDAVRSDWKSRRQSVNQLKEARLVHKNVPLVERVGSGGVTGGSVRWFDEGDDASEVSSRASSCSLTPRSPMISTGMPVPALQLSRRKFPTLVDDEEADEDDLEQGEARKYSIAMNILLEKDMNNEVALLQKDIEIEDLRKELEELRERLAQQAAVLAAMEEENTALRDVTVQVKVSV